MGITIEEIIVKETEIAQEFQKVVDTHMVSEDFSLEEMYCDDTEIIEEKLKKYQELADVHNQIADTMRKYQMMQADYENRLNADLVAMLTDFLMDIEENTSINSDDSHERDGKRLMRTEIIGMFEQKINSLKEDAGAK